MFDHFDRLAPIYERLVPPPDQGVLGPLLALSSGHVLLDAAGGTGRVSEALAVLAGRVVVCDASPRMLEQARKKGLETVQAELESLPFADATFDQRYTGRMNVSAYTPCRAWESPLYRVVAAHVFPQPTPKI